MPGQYITYDTVNVYKRARDAGCSQSVSAHIANISERSGSRIEQGEHQPKSKGDRGWRTRVDPLAEVWQKELEPMLQREPRLEATTLYEYLEERYPGQYESTLRTVQRRVQEWKAAHGAPQEVMFELHHAPGVVGHSDFTEVKQVSITIGGQPFEHLLYHYRLAYSGWQYVQVIQGGESFVALSEGLQNALQACGGVPQQHRTDSLSAAYRNGGGQRKPLTQFYQDLCQHYGLQPTRNNTGIAHENGSIESSHGYFKRRLRQALYLRGSTDFDSVAAYQAFIETLISRLNAKCAEAFSHEQAHLQPLPTYRYADYETLTVRVSCHSTISVRCILYSVPSRLVGRRLTVHLYHDRLVGYVGSQRVVELPRLRVSTSAPSRRARCINYRHVIESLRRKPRAFLHCRWQQELLPNDHWRQLWQDIGTQFDLESAGRLMVEALYLAATQDKETAVADYLEVQLQQQTLTLAGLQKHFQLLQPVAVPALDGQQHPLSSYDQLLPCPERHAEPQPEPEIQSDPQSSGEPSQPVTPTPAIIADAPPLERSRAAGDTTPLVVRPVLASTLRIGGGPS
jgi:transposase